MHPKRRSRLFIVLFLVVGAGISVALVLTALNENLNMFYPPEQVAGGEAPVGAQIRAGGMVLDGSINRDGETLDVSFILTDYKGAEFTVIYSGILPDLFREGQGVLVQGELRPDGHFKASQVLAKHDENYMPPELVELSQGQQKKPNPLSANPLSPNPLSYDQ
jgi:cytochrome c-type biogenesis protein CcmE